MHLTIIFIIVSVLVVASVGGTFLEIQPTLTDLSPLMLDFSLPVHDSSSIVPGFPHIPDLLNNKWKSLSAPVAPVLITDVSLLIPDLFLMPSYQIPSILDLQHLQVAQTSFTQWFRPPFYPLRSLIRYFSYSPITRYRSEAIQPISNPQRSQNGNVYNFRGKNDTFLTTQRSHKRKHGLRSKMLRRPAFRFFRPGGKRRKTGGIRLPLTGGRGRYSGGTRPPTTGGGGQQPSGTRPPTTGGYERQPSGTRPPTASGTDYIVMVPERIRDGSDLMIPVQLPNKPRGRVTINVKLTLNETDHLAKPSVSVVKVIAEASTVISGQDTTGVVTLKIAPGSIKSWTRYMIVVEGTGVQSFKNETNIYGRAKASASIVQTDKAVYKPGELVNYRVVTIGPNLEVKGSKLNIEIYDPRGNKIAERMGVGNFFGYDDNLQLADRPPLGNWRIKVTPPKGGRSDETNYNFEVQEYVLPKFKVVVEAPSFATAADESLIGKVKAEYTFGQPVIGTLFLTVSKRYSSGWHMTKAITKTYSINGEITFTIPMKALSLLSRNFDYENLRVVANVTEGITGLTHSGQADIRYHKQPYKIEFSPNMQENFKPYFNPLKVLARVTYHDGRPLINPTEMMKLTVTYFTDKPVTRQIANRVTIPTFKLISPFLKGEVILTSASSHSLQQDGKVERLLTIPPEAATASVKAEFAGQKVYKDLRRFRARGKVFMTVEMRQTGPLKIGDTVSVTLTTTSQQRYVNAYYIIVAKGMIVHFGEIYITGQPMTGSAQFTITREMAPSARLVGYFVTFEREFIADGLNFAVEDIYQHKVAVSYDQSQLEPKSDVNIQVTADRNSQVCVLAVDESVLLLKKGNDITPSRVNDVLRQFGDTPWFSRGWGPIIPWSMPADDSSDIINNANVKLLTDKGIKIHSFNLWSLNQARSKSAGFGAMDEGISMNGGRGGGGGGGGDVQGQIRKDFPETWVWHTEFTRQRSSRRAFSGGVAMNDAGSGAKMAFSSSSSAESGAPQGGRSVSVAQSSPTSRSGSQSFAMDSPPPPGQPGATGQIRKDFPETWIWKSVYSENGIVNIPQTVPDTITKYVVNAFAMNRNTGFGVAPVRANLTVFKVFFTQTRLPYSVIRGEKAVVQANVFNYHTQDLHVLVRLKGSNDFTGIVIDPLTQQEIELKSGEDMSKCVLVKSEVPTPVYFIIKPKVIGAIAVNVRVQNHFPLNRFDEVIRNLPVKAEGAEKSKNNPVFIAMKEAGSFRQSIPIKYPSTLVKDSEKIEVSITGDVFGPSLKNLDTLIRLPYGCGEQNMLRFAPAVFAAFYMKVTRTFDSNTELQTKIRNALSTGYQRQLLYLRHDGSFSTFGNADKEGSLWLTAFVIKSFAQAHALSMRGVFIDHKVIERSVRYIIAPTRQTKEGNFVNTGLVHNKAMQGGSATNLISLTAYVLICLHEVKKSQIMTDLSTIRNMDNAMLSATSYLSRQAATQQITTDYARAIGTYALALLKNPSSDALLKELEASDNKVEKSSEGIKYWNDTSNALQIEKNSYIMLKYTLVGETIVNGKRGTDHGMMILKWLVKQRNSYGGFSSTQDTVVALHALASFAALIYEKNVDLTIDVHTSKGGVAGQPQQVHLTSINHDVLHLLDFGGDVDTVEVNAKGSGIAMIDVKILFNIAQDPAKPSYVLTATVKDGSTKNKYTLDVCARFTKQGSKSNMAIFDVGFVSGFEPIIGLVNGGALMKRKEMSGGRIQLYFDEITKKDTCVSIPVQRVTQVAGAKPPYLRVYSYYEPEEASMVTYLPDSLKTSGLCATCGAECGCGSIPADILSLAMCSPP